MKSAERYRAWREQKKQIEVSQDFTKRLMSRLYQHEHAKSKPWLDSQQFFGWLSGHFWAKAGLALAAAIIGFIRFVIIFCAALG